MLRSMLNIGNNKSMNYLIVTILDNLFYIVIADDILEAMNFLRKRKEISFIIIDIDHQTKECIDFIQHIHSSTLYKRPVIGLVSGKNQKLTESVYPYLYACFVKPFNPVELIQCVNSIDTIGGLKPSTSMS